MGSKSSIKIGISLGDPAGIGPEVIFKALNEPGTGDVVPIVFGRNEILKKHYPALTDEYSVIYHDKEFSSDITSSKKYIYDIPLDLPIPVVGAGNIDTGLESRIYIDNLIDAWQRGFVDAVVTGPVNKGYINESGCDFAGHTEYIAGLINEPEPYMMMYSSDYRVLLITTHVPLSEVKEQIDLDSIYKTIKVGNDTAKALDGPEVKLAITGLDPHCGDSGAIGTFDMDITDKAVARARKDGINIEGPMSADTLFMSDKWKSYNLVIAHYHDQGLIPFKVLAFDSGVNITLGLSIIRTSPDHGTAYDIAGKGLASSGSMLEALKLARLLTQNKREES